MSPATTHALKDNKSQLKCPGRKEYRRLHSRHRHRRAAALLSLEEVRPSFSSPKPALLSHFDKQQERNLLSTVMLMTSIAEICPMEPTYGKMELGAEFFSEIFLFFLCITLFLTQKSVYHIEVTES